MKDHAANNRLRWKLRLPNQINAPVISQTINPININMLILRNIAPAS